MILTGGFLIAAVYLAYHFRASRFVLGGMRKKQRTAKDK